MKKEILAMVMVSLMLMTVFSTLSVCASFGESQEIIIIDFEVNPLGDGEDNPQVTIYVDDEPGEGPENPPEDYTSIQDAVNAASDGDTIYVYKGIYYENVIVSKPVILIGEDKETTIINGGGSGTVVKIKSSSVTMKEFTIENNGGKFGFDFGISMENQNPNIHNIHISNCIIKNNEAGAIRFNNIYDSSITNCYIKNNVAGILVLKSSDNIKINNCELENNGAKFNGGWTHNGGVFIYGEPEYQCSDITVTNCNIYDNVGYGVFVDRAENIEIHHNKIHRNTDNGIMIELNSFDVNIHDNIITENKNGLYLNRCKGCSIITRNTISLNNNYGIYIDSSSGNKILENNFINNQQSAGFYYNDKGQSNTWNKNYWDRPRVLPKAILGAMTIWQIKIPWVEYDLHPAKEPYEIGGVTGAIEMKDEVGPIEPVGSVTPTDLIEPVAPVDPVTPENPPNSTTVSPTTTPIPLSIPTEPKTPLRYQ